MKNKLAVVFLILGVCVAMGCASSPYQTQNDLLEERNAGRMTEEEYQAALRKQRSELPSEMQGGLRDPEPYYQYPKTQKY